MMHTFDTIHAGHDIVRGITRGVAFFLGIMGVLGGALAGILIPADLIAFIPTDTQIPDVHTPVVLEGTILFSLLVMWMSAQRSRMLFVYSLVAYVVVVAVSLFFSYTDGYPLDIVSASAVSFGAIAVMAYAVHRCVRVKLLMGWAVASITLVGIATSATHGVMPIVWKWGVELVTHISVLSLLVAVTLAVSGVLTIWWNGRRAAVLFGAAAGVFALGIIGMYATHLFVNGTIPFDWPMVFVGPGFLTTWPVLFLVGAAWVAYRGNA